MLSILVCHSYFLRFDEKQRQRAKPCPPLATLQVAALLREAGHEVTLFDAILAEGIADYEARLKAVRPQLVVFYEDNNNFLSKMCLGRMRRACSDMISLARAAGARVIAAGSDVTDAPEKYLAAGADAVLRGDWAHSSDRDYVVRGRRGREYYKLADQWLRNKVKAARIESQDPVRARELYGAARQAKAAMQNWSIE